MMYGQLMGYVNNIPQQILTMIPNQTQNNNNNNPNNNNNRNLTDT